MIPNINEVRHRLEVIDCALTQKGIEITYNFDGKEIPVICLNPEESAECLRDHGLIEGFEIHDGILVITCESVYDRSNHEGEHEQDLSVDCYEWPDFAMGYQFRYDDAVRIAAFTEWGKIIAEKTDITKPIQKITNQAS